jgi:glycosyltransferase involved in cell wall biosynthesis
MSVSVVIPCLNEEASIEECIRLIRAAFGAAEKIEIIIADNGSTDRSREIASKSGVRVVEERRRGYGAAILCGLREASHEFVVIGDADNTYDFRDAVLLVDELKKGAEFAIGDRINGQVEPGAMPWLHQHLGTPVLTWILNQFFGSRVHDINCGLRAVRRNCIDRMRLRSPGMEFASEMVIHAAKASLKFAEVPIRYYQRHHGQAKLRTFRDGWRHLRFILLCAPFPVYVVPAALGAVISYYLFQSNRLGVQLLGNITLLSTIQILIFGILAKAYLWVADSFIVDRAFGRMIEKFQLEFGILISALVALAGILFLNRLDLANLIRGSAFVALSVQIFFSSFLLSTIVYKKRDTI